LHFQGAKKTLLRKIHTSREEKKQTTEYTEGTEKYFRVMRMFRGKERDLRKRQIYMNVA